MVLCRLKIIITNGRRTEGPSDVNRSNNIHPFGSPPLPVTRSKSTVRLEHGPDVFLSIPTTARCHDSDRRLKTTRLLSPTHSRDRTEPDDWDFSQRRISRHMRRTRERLRDPGYEGGESRSRPVFWKSRRESRSYGGGTATIRIKK